MPDVSLEFHRRLKKLKETLDQHFTDLQKFALEVLDTQEISMRMY